MIRVFLVLGNMLGASRDPVVLIQCGHDALDMGVALELLVGGGHPPPARAGGSLHLDGSVGHGVGGEGYRGSRVNTGRGDGTGTGRGNGAAAGVVPMKAGYMGSHQQRTQKCQEGSESHPWWLYRWVGLYI
jgi:hypothetical protein